MAGSLLVWMQLLAAPTLAHHAHIVWRIGGFEEDAVTKSLLAVIDPVQRALVVLWREFLVFQSLAAACRHEQEGVKGGGAQV